MEDSSCSSDQLSLNIARRLMRLFVFVELAFMPALLALESNRKSLESPPMEKLSAVLAAHRALGLLAASSATPC